MHSQFAGKNGLPELHEILPLKMPALQLVMHNFLFNYSARLPLISGTRVIQNQTNHHFTTVKLITKI